MRTNALRRLGPRTLAALVALAAMPLAARAQFPAELTGRVVEQGTSRPIEGARIEIAGVARTITDASGAFTLRAREGGSVDVIVSHPGYAVHRDVARLEAGRTTMLLVALWPAPVVLEGLEVVTTREPGVLLTRLDIERSGARSLADLLRDVPGVVVRNAGAGGERISIRGGAADEVLVLVDGRPLNDPLTGEADAGALSLQGVASVRIHAGAQSARYGARAATGVVLVETAAAVEPYLAATLRAGSLGAAGVEAEAATEVAGATMSAGVRYAQLDGEFDYARPESLGGGTVERVNGGERELGGFAAVALPLAGALRLRADGARIERGLPGPMHAPTPRARQELQRATVGVTWDAVLPLAELHVAANAGWHRQRYDDPAPAFGPPYHDTTHVREAGVRIEAERRSGGALARMIAVGAETRAIELESSALEPARVRRVDPAIFARGALGLPGVPLAPRLSAGLRADRWSDEWLASHEVALRASHRSVSASVAHRSAFAPPAASDQFFGAGFAIAPNPDLEPERVRSEVELTLTAALDAAGVPLELGASAFRADIEGMIVWAPDFRFVWSPRNRDVKRSGGEAWLRARPLPDVELGAWAALARVTYDWPGNADTVQVVYRPRHSGGASLDWRPADWSLGLDAIYTGVRYATPGHANPLRGYWDVRVALGRRWRFDAGQLDVTLRVDRLFDNTDSFVHGYAEAGRRISFEVRLRALERDDALALNGIDR